MNRIAALVVAVAAIGIGIGLWAANSNSTPEASQRLSTQSLDSTAADQSADPEVLTLDCCSTAKASSQADGPGALDAGLLVSVDEKPQEVADKKAPEKGANSEKKKSVETEKPPADGVKPPEAGKKKVPAKKYPKADPNLGQIAGLIRFKGKMKDMAPFVVDPGNKDIAVCKAHAKDDRLIVGKDGLLANAVVTLHKYKPRKRAKPRKDAVIDNKGCMFVPRVLATTAGSELTITNSDPVMHNCRGVIDMNFNVAIAPKGKHVEKSKTKEGYVIVLCDFHPWMNARLHFFPHDQFDVTDPTGSYRLVNVPPGTYTLEVRHEILASKFVPHLVKNVVVKKGETTKLDVELPQPKR